MVAKNEILDYITRKELTGALLLTGKWGCGKTYLIKQIAEELHKDNKAEIAVISLFGLESVEAVRKSVKEEYANLSSTEFGRQLRKMKKKAEEVAQDGAGAIEATSIISPHAGAALKGASTVLSIDYMKWFYKVKNTFKNGKPFIISFDDLERNSINEKVLLGVINDYIENDRIKVIIIANEEEIKKGKSKSNYTEYKEKIIAKTIVMEADCPTVICQLIYEFEETAKGYKTFLSDNAEKLIQVFVESKSNNFRTVRYIFSAFERVYEAWNKTDVPNDNMKWVLYTFAVNVFKSREKKEIDSGENKDNIQKESIKAFFSTGQQYKDEGINNSHFITLNNLVLNNVWEEEAFIQELEYKYTMKSEPPFSGFLNIDFWALQQKNIEEGLPQALESAYAGKLSRRDLIILFQRIHALTEEEIPLPCVIDYEKIEKGLQIRIGKIKSGEIKEPACNVFSEIDELDESAIAIYKEINSIENKIIIWEKRRDYLKALREDSLSSLYSLNRLCFEELDDELLEAFMKKYQNVNNYLKREYALSLLNADFVNPQYSAKNNIIKTKKNTLELKKRIEELSKEDAITNLINKSFIEKIDELIEKLDEKLK